MMRIEALPNYSFLPFGTTGRTDGRKVVSGKVTTLEVLPKIPPGGHNSPHKGHGSGARKKWMDSSQEK